MPLLVAVNRPLESIVPISGGIGGFVPFGGGGSFGGLEPLPGGMGGFGGMEPFPGGHDGLGGSGGGQPFTLQLKVSPVISAPLMSYAVAVNWCVWLTSSFSIGGVITIYVKLSGKGGIGGFGCCLGGGFDPLPGGGSLGGGLVPFPGGCGLSPVPLPAVVFLSEDDFSVPPLNAESR
jgi:hypothetical protein